MTEMTPETPRTPGIVIFAAVLNFIGAFFGFLFALLCLAALVFSQALNLSSRFQETVTQYSSGVSVDPTTAGATIMIVIGMLLILGLVMGAGSLYFGLGLLKGKRWAWYVQVITSVLGLFGIFFGLPGFPSTVFNVVILVFFFQRRIRDFFKVT